MVLLDSAGVDLTQLMLVLTVKGNGTDSWLVLTIAGGTGTDTIELLLKWWFNRS